MATKAELEAGRKTFWRFYTFMFIFVVIPWILNNCKETRESREKYERYHFHSRWRLMGQMKSFSEPLYGSRGNTPTQDLYLIEIDVDTIEFFRNDLPEDSPYYGVYNKNTKKAYIIANLYNPETNDSYKQSDPKPYIHASTRSGLLTGSNGLRDPIGIGPNTPLEEMAKDTANFIRF